MRLKQYDYSQNGAYFITFCTDKRRNILGKILVGDGVLDVPKIQLSPYGKIAEKYINSINNHYNDILIEKYVIMPNHIHMIISIISKEHCYEQPGTTGTSRTPSPTNSTIPMLISTYKRLVNKDIGFNIWQRSYYDHIIRTENEYLEIWQYIENNPYKWEEDDYYTE